MKIRNWLVEGIKLLEQIPFSSPQKEVEILLAESLKLTREEIYINLDTELPQNKLLTLARVIHRRLQREPLQYILGYTYFFEEKFLVTNNTFIPRPETELLVEAILSRARQGIIVDLGTGSGNIIIPLAKRIKNSTFIATDISEKALILARKNAKRLKVLTKIEFLSGNLFTPLINYQKKIYCLVSNPPYLSKKDFSNLQPEIKNYEPKIALDGGEDGLFYYRKIIKEANKYLLSSGYLFLEVGDNQADKIIELLYQNGFYEKIENYKDLQGIKRIIIAQIKKNPK